MKRIRWWRLVVALVLLWLTSHLVALGVLALTDRTLLRRALTYDSSKEVTQMDWYEPLEPVPGDHRPLPRATQPRIAEKAIADAIAYAAGQDSTALLVLHQGEVVVEEYFGPFDASSRVNGMSMVKTIMALLVGVAIEAGHLPSVDEPVATFIPEWSDERSAITLRHLLQMSSGLRRSDVLFNPWSDLVQMHMSDDARKVALSVPRERPPGEVFSYNNVNTQVLGEVLHRATGQRVAHLLSERLWRPLGASDAAFWLDREGGMPKVYCCLLATPRDWAKVGQLLLDKGRVGDIQLVSSSWIERMLQPSPVHDHYGLHIWLGGPDIWDDYPRKKRSEPFVANDTVWLDGRSNQRVYVIPSHQLVIVRVGPRAPSWDESVLPNTLVRGLKASTTVHIQ